MAEKKTTRRRKSAPKKEVEVKEDVQQPEKEAVEEVKAQEVTPVDAPVVHPTINTLRVRKYKSIHADVLCRVAKDDELKIIEEGNTEWALVETGDGTRGWVKARFLTPPRFLRNG